MPPEPRAELLRLLAALCDGELRGADFDRLEDLLRADPENRRAYLRYLDLHAGLAAKLPAAPAEVPPRAGPWPQRLRYALVAAGTLAASLLMQWAAGTGPVAAPARAAHPVIAAAVAPAGYVATVTHLAGCVWEDAAPRAVGSRLLAGEVRLARGAARLRFDSGPELTLEGPAALRLDSPQSAALLRGRVLFRGDDTSAPFDLRTPAASLVDFGTEYAVRVGPEGEELHVFDGEVQRTPAAPAAAPDVLTAGQAKRYAADPADPGRPTPLAPPPRRAAPPAVADGQLIAYEGFDYADPDALTGGRGTGGAGWVGPWDLALVRPLNPGDESRDVLTPAGLGRPGAPGAGGAFRYGGFTKAFRRLREPLRLDAEGVYYLSYLFRSEGPPLDPLNVSGVLFWAEDDYRAQDGDPRGRLNVGVGGANHLFAHLGGAGNRTPVPLAAGVTYLLTAKVVASGLDPDQVLMRVYGPDEPVDREEPASWTVVGPPLSSDRVFDYLQVHVNSRRRQSVDELRVGTTWASVAGPWAAP